MFQLPFGAFYTHVRSLDYYIDSLRHVYWHSTNS
jgi:hypothetical protein